MILRSIVHVSGSLVNVAPTVEQGSVFVRLLIARVGSSATGLTLFNAVPVDRDSIQACNAL